MKTIEASQAGTGGFAGGWVNPFQLDPSPEGVGAIDLMNQDRSMRKGGAADMNWILKAMGDPGTRVFRPTGPWPFQEKVTEHQVGPSNRERAQDISDSHRAGSPATGGSVTRINPITGQSKTAGGSVQDRAANFGGVGAPDASAASVVIVESITALNRTLQGLSETGIRLPESFSQDIQAIGHQIATGFDNTLSVTLEGTNNIVTVSNLSEITTAIAASSTNTVGAEQFQRELVALQEDLFVAGGPIDQKIAEATADLLSADTQFADEIRLAFSDINTVSTDLAQLRGASVNVTIPSLEKKIAANERISQRALTMASSAKRV
jgi:hypothetical protein